MRSDTQPESSRACPASSLRSVRKGDLDAAWRRALARPGRRAVRRAVAHGLPGELGPPLEALFASRPAPAEAEVEARIAALREALRAGAGGDVLHVRTGETSCGRRTGAGLASISSVPAEWGLLLHRLARAVGAARILELGSCAGISGAYLASAPGCQRFVGIEGSPDLARRAEATVAGVRPGARVLAGLFDETLDEGLETLGGRPGLVFVDGERRHREGIALLRWLLPRVEPGGAVVLDDLRFTPETRCLWRDARALPEVGASIDLGRMGVLVAGLGRGDHSLARWTGLWVVRPRRRPPPAAG